MMSFTLQMQVFKSSELLMVKSKTVKCSDTIQTIYS